MPAETKLEYTYDLRELDKALELVMPHYVNKGATISPVMFGPKESKMNGFWTVIDVKGGQAPTSRENATLFIANWNGTDWLTLIGGTNQMIGTAQLSAYTFSLNKKKWMKVDVAQSSSQTKGSRPVVAI